MTVIRSIKANILPAKQSCPGAPYVIRRADLENPTICRAVKTSRAIPDNSRQKALEYE